MKNKLILQMDKPFSNQWSDIFTWNTFHSAQEFLLHSIQTFDILDAFRYYPIIEKYEEKSVWISACGKELAPWLYANIGCKVLATDISDVAMTFQRELMKMNPFEVLDDFAEALEKAKISYNRNFIMPELEVHDSRKNIDTEDLFYVILDRQTFTGFSPNEMEKVAHVYKNALEEGGTVVLDTLNIQGNQRTVIENILLKAGFFIPEIEATQWYRNQLDATGIEYMMVLGTPILSNRSSYEYKGGYERAQADEEKLKSFRPRYNEKLKENQLRDQRRANKTDKTAIIIYNIK